MADLQAADTSRASLRYIKETSWGEVPSSGKMKDLRFTGESLNISNQTTTSDEIRSDRQIIDLIQTKVEADGDISGEFSYETYDSLIESALANSWSTAVDGDIAGVAVVGGKLKYPAGGLPANLVLGQAIKLDGFDTDANNRVVIVKAVDIGNREVEVVPGLANEAATTSNVTTKGQAIKNGVDIVSFLIEKDFTDVDKILAYKGMAVDQMTLNVESEEKVTVSFSFMGKDGEALAGSASLNPGASVDEAPDSEIIISTAEDSVVLEGDEEAGFIKSLTVQIANNYRGRTAVGIVGNVSLGQGRFMVTGNLQLYFEDFGVYEKYLRNEETSLAFTLASPEGDIYVVHLPRIKLTESSIPVPGIDQDVMVEGSYQALRDESMDTTIIITKIDSE